MKKTISFVLFIFLIGVSSLGTLQAKGLDYTDKASMLVEINAYNIAILSRLGDNLKKDKDFMFQAAEAFSPSLKYADSSLLKDKEYMLKLVIENPSLLTYADDSLKKDKDVVWTAIFNNKSYEKEGVLEDAHPSLLKDKVFILNVIKQLNHPASTLKYIHKDLKKDKAFIIEALKDGRGFLMMHIPSEFKNDKDVCKEAIKTSSHLLSYMGKEIQNDREFVLKALAREESGEALEYVSDTLKKDKEVVLAALKSSSLALAYADSSLRNDKNIILVAAKTHAKDNLELKKFLAILEPSFRKDKDILAILEN